MKLNNRTNLSVGIVKKKDDASAPYPVSKILPNLKKLSNARKIPIGRRKEEKSRHLTISIFLLIELEFCKIA